MLHLNSYRQAIYSWLTPCICAITSCDYVCVFHSLLAAIITCWQLPFVLVFIDALTFSKRLVVQMTHARTHFAHTPNQQEITRRGKYVCSYTWQIKPSLSWPLEVSGHTLYTPLLKIQLSQHYLRPIWKRRSWRECNVRGSLRNIPPSFMLVLLPGLIIALHKLLYHHRQVNTNLLWVIYHPSVIQ